MKVLDFKDKQKNSSGPLGKKDHIDDKGKRIRVASNFFPAACKQEQREHHFQEIQGKKVIAKDFTSRKTVFHVSEL